MTSIRVEYTRKIGQHGEFSSVGVGGSVERTVPDGVDWQSLYALEFTSLKALVDGKIGAALEDAGAATNPAPAASAPLSSEVAPPVAATPEVSQPSVIVPKAPVAIQATVAGKVWHNSQGTKGEHVKVRVNGPLIPSQEGLPSHTVDVKCFDAKLIPSILDLQKDDAIIIKGYFDEPYNGKHDLRAQAVERA